MIPTGNDVEFLFENTLRDAIELNVIKAEDQINSLVFNLYNLSTEEIDYIADYTIQFQKNR